MQGSPSEDRYNFQQYKTRKHFSNLDGLRFICIAAVLWHHANPLASSEIMIAGRGFLGVDFFFVLSGFLITTILLRERDRLGYFSLKNFYIRRAIRILPVYYLVVGAVSAYYIFIKGETELASLVPYYVFFLSNFLITHIPTLGITWSLSVEEQFYLIWPLALLFLPKRAVLPVLSIVIILNVVASAGLLSFSPMAVGDLKFALPNSTFAPILMGAALAVGLNRPEIFTVIARLLGHKLAPMLLLFGVVAAAGFTPADIRGWPNLLIHSLMTLALASMVIREDGIGLWFLRNRIVSRIGVVSYGIYLYHLIGLDITNRLFNALDIENGWLLLGAYSLLSILIAEISFRTLEAYFRRFRPY